MKTVDELCRALDASRLPWANGQWWPATPPPLPYALLCAEGSSTFWADGLGRLVAERYRIEIYSHGRSYEAEEAVRSALSAEGIASSSDPGVPVDQTDVTMACVRATVLPRTADERKQQ